MPEPTDLAVRRGAQKLLDLVAGVTAADEADLDAMIAEARDRGEAKVAALRRQVLDAEAEADLVDGQVGDAGHGLDLGSIGDGQQNGEARLVADGDAQRANGLGTGGPHAAQCTGGTRPFR